MKSWSKTPPSAEPFIITTDDGQKFRCWVSSVGSQGQRWVLVAADGLRYIGPPVGDLAPAAVQTLLNTWWQERNTRRGPRSRFPTHAPSMPAVQPPEGGHDTPLPGGVSEDH
ncbi:MAG: hypothetical protein ABJF01_11960 [bacterium]